MPADSHHRRRGSTDFNFDYDGPGPSSYGEPLSRDLPPSDLQHVESLRSGPTDYVRAERGYGPRKSFEFDPPYVDEPGLQSAAGSKEPVELGHGGGPHRGYDPGYGRPPPPGDYRDAPMHMRPIRGSRGRSGHVRRESISAHGQMDMLPDREVGSSLRFSTVRRTMEINLYSFLRRDAITDTILRTWQIETINIVTMRTSMQKCLRGRGIQDLKITRVGDYPAEVPYYGNAAYAPETSAASTLRPQFRASMMRVDDRPSLSGPRSAISPDVRAGAYNAPRRTLWEQPQSLWRQNSQAWDAGPLPDRQPRARESERFDSGMRLNEPLQDLGPLATPIKPRRGGTPVESPVSGTAPWLAPTDGGFTYFARGVGAPSPSTRNSGAGISSTPVQPRIPIDSLTESSDRLGEIEEEIAKYREMLRTLQSAADDDVAGDNTTPVDAQDDVTTPGTPAASAEDDGSAEELQGSAEDSDAVETEIYERPAVVDETWNLEDTAAGKILQENRRQALESEAEVAFKIPVRRLVGDVSNMPLVQKNIAIHQRVKGAILRKVSKRFAANQRKRQKLKDAYTQHLADWRKKIEDQEAEAEALAQEAAKKKRKLGKAAGPASGLSRGSRRSAFSSDMVRTEAEFQEALAMLGDNDIDHDPNKSAVEPAMIIDPVMRQLIRYKDENNLVADPAGDMQRYNARLQLIWSEDEQRVLRQLLSRYRKSFSTISSQLPRKSTRDVVHFYYREKHKSLRSVIPLRPGKVQKRRDRVGEEEEGQQPKGSRRGRGKEAGAGRKDSTARRGPRAAAAREAVELEEGGDETLEPDALENNMVKTTVSSSVVVTTQEGSDNPDVVITEVSMVRAEEMTTEVRRPLRKAGDSGRPSADDVQIDDAADGAALQAANKMLMARDAGTHAEHFTTSDFADLRNAGDGDGRQRKRGAGAAATGVNAASAVGTATKRKDGDDTGGGYSLLPNEILEGDAANGGIDAFRASPHAKRTISYWNSEETISFRDAYASFGKDWESVAQRVGSKSAKQAQNYYKRNQMEMDLIRLSDSRLRSGGASGGGADGTLESANELQVGGLDDVNVSAGGAVLDGTAGFASSSMRSDVAAATLGQIAGAAAVPNSHAAVTAATPQLSVTITLNAAPRVASKLTALFGLPRSAARIGDDSGGGDGLASVSADLATITTTTRPLVVVGNESAAPPAASMPYYQASEQFQHHPVHHHHQLPPHQHHIHHLHHNHHLHSHHHLYQPHHARNGGRSLVLHPSLLAHTGSSSAATVAAAAIGHSLGSTTTTGSANNNNSNTSRVVSTPLQAASALAAQRVAKLAQNRINSQVEVFIRKQSAAATAVPVAVPTNVGFAPIPRGFCAFPRP
ncbi:hypothetical protein HDU86_000289 [Geranomyces michiganensis]|nr:hypothetical protein HDU86_000289 [Geranomyces michiganensis]